MPVFDHPDTLPVQIDATRTGRSGEDPGFRFALDEQPASSEQELTANLADVVVEFPSFLGGKEIRGNSVRSYPLSGTGQPADLVDFGLGKQFTAVGGDQLLAGEIAYKTLQRPYRRWMKMRLGLFQRHDRGAFGPCFEKRREQHQHREALRAFAVTLHGNLGPADGPQIDPGVGQHVVYPAGDGLDRDHVASRERNDVLYAAKAIMYPLEAVVGADDELVHFSDHPFELRLFLNWKLCVLQKRPPERSLFPEVVPGVSKRLQIEVRYLPLKSGERSLADRGQRLPVEVQE